MKLAAIRGSLALGPEGAGSGECDRAVWERWGRGGGGGGTVSEKVENISDPGI